MAGASSARRASLPYSLCGVLEPHDRARHPGGTIARAAELVDRLAICVEIHRGSRGSGCGLAKIDEGVAPILEVDGHEPAAADIAATRVDDGERIADRNRRVDRIAALGKDPRTDLGGVVLGRNHHTVLGLDRRRRGRASLAYQHPGHGKRAEEPPKQLQPGNCPSGPAGKAARHTMRLRAGSASAGIPWYARRRCSR